MKIHHSISAPSLAGHHHHLEDSLAMIFHAILGKGDFDTRRLSKKFFKEVFVLPSSELLELFAFKINDHFEKLRGQIVNVKNELFLAHLISLIPYCYPKKNAHFYIPVKQGDQYQLEDYTVDDVIELKIHASLTPQLAFCLRHEHLSPLLVFLGTTFPSASGFCTSLIADFTPFMSVGKISFLAGFSELRRFFDLKRDVKVYGVSLGGALAFHTAKIFHKHIKHTYAVNPAGLHHNDYFLAQSKLTIVTQEGDFVSKLGFFPGGEKVRVFHLDSPTKEKNLIWCHARSYAGKDDVRIRHVDVQVENKRPIRHVTLVAHVVFSMMAVFLIAGCIGLHFGLRRTVRWLTQGK